MTPERAHAPLLLALGTSVLGALACGPEASESTGELQSNAVTSADERTYIVRAAVALLGRSPLDENELNQFAAATAAVDDVTRRNDIANCMMGSDTAPVCQTAREAFNLHWTQVLMDHFRVSRRSDGQRTVPACWVQSGLPDALTPAERATQEGIVQGHVASGNANPAMTPATVPANFTMLDVLRGSVQGSLLAALRGNMYAQMTVDNFGAQLSETNKRAETWTRFESSYLNRQQLCLGCHNTDFSIAGAASDWNRHAPTPFRVEDAALGCSSGACQEPPDLHADFRHDGLAGQCTPISNVYVIDCTTTFSGGQRPWNMAGACGAFNPPTDPSAATPPACATHPSDFDPKDPTDPDALLDPCFNDQSGAHRQPGAQFTTPAFPVGSNLRLGSPHRLDNQLVLGADRLRVTDLGDVGAVRNVPGNPSTTRTREGGAEALTIMAAATLIERVWEEVFGSKLTIALHYPRVGKNNYTETGMMRDTLHDLTREFVRSGWSLRSLLLRMVSKPEFNVAARVAGQEYGMDLLFNPWVLHDPRSRPAATSGERCNDPVPSFEGCVKQLLYRDRCVFCHENSTASLGGPFFDHANYASTVAVDAGPGWGGTYPSQAACEDDRDSTACLAPPALVNCATMWMNPGSKIAVRVSCTVPLPADDQSTPTRRMPFASPPMPNTDRDAIVNWVKGDSAMGIAGGRQGTPLGMAPPPPIDPTAPDPTGADLVPVLHNGVGDQVHWKSPFQLTFGVGTVLGLSPWQDPTQPENQLIPRDGTASGYPSREVAEAAGHYLDDGIAGGRGMSLLELLRWEKGHTSTAGEFCRFGTAADRLTNGTFITLGASVRDIVGALKHSFMGESDIDETERPLIEAVLGPGYSLVEGAATTVTDVAATAGALRNVCNVFMKAPLFLLSYVEPTDVAMAQFAGLGRFGGPGGRGNGHGHADDDFILPALCGGRLDCRQVRPLVETTLARCWADPKSCRFGAGEAVTETVRAALLDLRLPVAKPALSLERALVEDPTAVPGPNDPRRRSNLLALPFEDGRVLIARGDIKALFKGRFRELHRGDTLRYGEALFIPEGAKLAVKVGNDVYSTGKHGMEEPPPFAPGIFDEDDDEDCRDPHHRGHGFGHHHRHHHHEQPHGVRKVWMLMCNGPRGRADPPGGVDPRIPVGDPTGQPTGVPHSGTVPSWAQHGEAGLWYARP
jgi:hypothetical protein